jgi:hypothetical protein
MNHRFLKAKIKLQDSKRILYNSPKELLTEHTTEIGID